jgi:hypothetical protein
MRRVQKHHRHFFKEAHCQKELPPNRPKKGGQSLIDFFVLSRFWGFKNTTKAHTKIHVGNIFPKN